MKRISAIISLVLMMVMMTASFSFAAEGQLKVKEQYPKDGATGMSVENASIKIWFDKDVYPKNKDIRKANKKAIKLVDQDGKNVPVYVAYSPDEEGLMMVLSTGDAEIVGDTEYTLTIDESFQATNGDKLVGGDTVTFKTLNQKRTTTVNMLLMVVMMAGMIFFSTKSVKKQAEKEKKASGKHETVNPYKEAKRTGKSVEEIVAKDQKVKQKEAEAKAKRDAKREKILEEQRREDLNIKKVSKLKPISEAGGKYRVPTKTQKKEQKSNKGTTRPKNQSGKQKNTKKK